MLSYQNVAQNEYQKEKDIPSPSPLTRPKSIIQINNLLQFHNPSIHYYHLICKNFNRLSHQFISPNKQWKMIDNRKLLILIQNQIKPIPKRLILWVQLQIKDINIIHLYSINQINPQEQMLLEKQQFLMEEGEDLKQQVRKFQNENPQPKQVIDQLQPELQQCKNQKSIEQELKAKFDYQEQMIVKLKSDVRRKQEALQENQYKLAELDKIQKKLEDYNLLSSKSNELNKQIKDLQDQIQDQKRQLVYLNTAEHENSTLKEYIETYKQQLREKDIKIEQYREQQEQLLLLKQINFILLLSNRQQLIIINMKSTLDMLNFEFKKQQENSNDQLHRATLQITDLQGQVSSYQKTLGNQALQIELQKQQVKQLEIKEKELYCIINLYQFNNTKNQLLKLEESIQDLNQQNYYLINQSLILSEQKEIEKLTMTLKNGKQEYLNQQQKLQNAEQEIKKQSDQLQQLQKYRDELIHQCQFLEQEVKKKQGNLDQSINQAQHKQIEMKIFLDQQQKLNLINGRRTIKKRCYSCQVLFKQEYITLFTVLFLLQINKIKHQKTNLNNILKVILQIKMNQIIYSKSFIIRLQFCKNEKNAQ